MGYRATMGRLLSLRTRSRIPPLAAFLFSAFADRAASAGPPETAISPGPRGEPAPAAADAEAVPEDSPASDPATPMPADAALTDPPTEPAASDRAPPTSGTITPGRDPAVSATLKRRPPGAEPPPLPARHRLVYSNLLVLRVNPLGAEDRFVLGYQLRLYNKPGALFRDAYFGVAFSPTVSPSISRIGAQIDIAPLTILRFRAGYYLSTWYGSHRFKAHPFETPYAEYGPDTLKARADAKQGLSTFGGQAELGVLFQLKFGPVALRNELIAYHNNIRLPSPTDVFYDLRHDVLVPGRGWFLSNDTDLLYVSKFGLAAGVRNSMVHVFYPAGVYEAADAQDNPNTPMDRLGPLLSYTFYDKPERRFNKPTLLFSAQWWLKHRYRTGDEVHQGIPLFLLGFAFSGELLRSKD